MRCDSLPSLALTKLALVCSCLLLSGCINFFPSDKIDPSGNLSRGDYLALRQRGDDALFAENVPASPPPVPALPAPQKPPKPSLPKKTINLSVTDSVPLRDVLIELGREGKLNMEIDPRIQGGVFFTAHDQPFDKVLRRLCSLAGLRYRMESGFVRIELDEPYYENYPLDFLSLSRSASSEVTIATNVFDVDIGAGNTADKNSNDNNSTAKISSRAEANFWGEVEKTLPRLLSSAGRSRNKQKEQASFSLDKQAGLVTVFGDGAQQEAVQRYLSELRRKASAQVLIEARIVEVELSDDFKSGVNWSELFKGKEGLTASFGAPSASDLISSADTGLFSARIRTEDFTGILNLVRTFGTTRVLSSPRLTVMNNQTAVLKVARNEVYFVTSAQFPTTVTASGATVSGTPVYSSTPRTVPVGLVMTVQPAISADTDRVTLTMRPTISRVVDRVSDPSIGLNAANAGITDPVQSKIPVLAVREMDSVLQLRSGEVVVMGGLMQDSSDNRDQGVPPFDAVPLLGNFAKSRSNEGTTSELVILLRATILSNPAPDEADRELYDRYGRDPRPLFPLQPTEEPTNEKS